MPSRRNNDDADEHEGPLPMKNYKPVKRHPNSADQFWQSHQAQYEERGERATPPPERVQRHNAAYPQLIDELNKRRSLTKVIAVQTDYEISIACNACSSKRRRNVKRCKMKPRRIAKRNAQQRRQYRINDRIRDYISKHCRRCQLSDKRSRNSSLSAADLADIDANRRSKVHSNASGSKKFKSNTATTKTSVPSCRSSSTLGLENEPMLP